jgi:hypothetical protein
VSSTSESSSVPRPESRSETRAEPRHRATRRRPRLRTLGSLVTRHLVVAGVAAVATGGAVATGVVASSSSGQDTVAALMSQAADGAAMDAGTAAELDSREQGLSRSASRTEPQPAADPAKQRQLAQEARSGGQVTRSKDLASGDPREIAQAMLPEFGFSSSEFGCLEALWTKESGWDPHAANPSSSAYGIPQALPGEKMASEGPDWADNPATQIRWGLGYIAGRYGTPCGAWSHSQSNGWY